ncbi:Vacuolar fusion protein mon1b [Dinochytrium kinnereticum]|nr:Vacuolar fusion protein mon1b [Dinochytrium kinnereticum]
MPTLEEVSSAEPGGSVRELVVEKDDGGSMQNGDDLRDSSRSSTVAPSAGAAVNGTKEWARRRRHFFVLSSAGKPVYSRYGDEAELSSYMGILQAIISFFINEDDTLMSLTAGEHRFVFKARGPLYLVAVVCSGEDESELGLQLDHLYSQVLFILTSTQLTRIFTQRTNYDLRSLLTGTDMFFDELCRSHLRGMAFNLQSFQCLRVSPRVRSSVASALVTGAPKVGAFVHSYVCFLTQELCLVLISPDKDSFFEMSEFKTAVAVALDENGCADEIEEAILSDPYKMVEIEVPSIRHFVCRPKGVAQLTEPYPLPPYTKKADYRRLLLHYQYAHRKLEDVDGSVKLIFNSGIYETVVGWSSNSYEFFAAFGPLVTKETVSSSLTLLQKWIKQNDTSLFITSHPTF